MFKLLPYMKKYRVQSLLAPLFKMTEALFDLFVPLVVSGIIDGGIVGGREDVLSARLARFDEREVFEVHIRIADCERENEAQKQLRHIELRLRGVS